MVKTIDTNGPLLHACKLEFIHPTTKEYMSFEAEPDQTFKNILEKLRKGDSV